MLIATIEFGASPTLAALRPLRGQRYRREMLSAIRDRADRTRRFEIHQFQRGVDRDALEPEGPEIDIVWAPDLGEGRLIANVDIAYGWTPMPNAEALFDRIYPGERAER